MANEAVTNQAELLEALASQLTETARSLRDNPDSQIRFVQRTKVIQAAKTVLGAVKQPADNFIDFMVTFSQLVALRLFIKWRVFEEIPTKEPIAYADLAAKVGAEVALISRLSKVLVSTNVLKQVGTDKVAHTADSEIYTTVNSFRAMVQMGFDDHLRIFASMPGYFDKYGLKEPTGRYHTVAAFAAGQPDLTVWEVMNQDKERTANFMLAMNAFEANYPTLGSYDLSWAVAKGEESPDRVLVVDVGGSRGHALKKICQDTPGLAISRCVLEDLPDVINATKNLEDEGLRGVQLISMDFHNEQPVKGALIYYIRRCLHDYGDEVCVGILQQLSDAMASDSKLLIVEQVMGNPPAPFAAATDLFMLTLGGKERSHGEFQALAGRAGLKIQQVHRNEGTDVAVVECVKA